MARPLTSGNHVEGDVRRRARLTVKRANGRLNEPRGGAKRGIHFGIRSKKGGSHCKTRRRAVISRVRVVMVPIFVTGETTLGTVQARA
jgi:hypothetical protein